MMEPLKETTSSFGKWEAFTSFLKFFLPLTVFVNLSFLLYYNAVEKLKTAETNSEERFYVEIAKNHINQDLEFLGSDILVLAQNEKLEKLLEWNTDFNRQALAKIFLSIAKERQLYDQIRYINGQGKEIARVNFNSGKPEIVSEDHLQNKADRYYFKKSLKLDQGELYVSPFDLNKERGEIEKPLKPMLRIGTPVFDAMGRKQGVIILNYLGARLIDRFDDALSRSSGNPMFMNDQGHLFRGSNHAAAWGFMTGKGSTFADKQPDIWQQIKEVREGQIQASTGLYTFTTITPAARISRFRAGNDNMVIGAKWKILTHVPANVLGSVNLWKDHRILVLMYMLLMLLSVLACIYVTINGLNKKQAQLAMLNSEERYRQIAGISSDWAWEMDEELRISHLSSSFEKLTGVEPAFMIGKTRQELTRPEELNTPVWQEHLAVLDARQEFRNFPLKFYDPKGNIRHFSVSGVPVFEVSGNFAGYRGTCSDTTQMVKAQNLLKITSERAESANRAKSEFLASMSHELRTPLNSIIGFSQVLKDEMFGSTGSKNNKDYIEIINTAGTHLHRLIGDILDISKIEAGEFELTTGIIDIATLFDECVAMLGERAGKKRISLKIRMKDDFPAIIADELKLKQIILNLLSNAIKFTNEDGEIILEAEIKKKGGILLSVIDNGIGISAEDLPRVTNPFEQTGSVMTRQQEGTGLGLALAKSLTELHDGSLRLESQLGEGTKVSLSFPESRTVHTS